MGRFGASWVRRTRALKRLNNTYEVGSVWTLFAIDTDTKIVPSYKVGKRDSYTTDAFIADLASRLKNRIQLASDGFPAYLDAFEQAWGSDLDYGQVVKSYQTEDSKYTPERKYSPPKFVSVSKFAIAGNPDLLHAHTSHVERLNASTRLHVKRLNRLTLASSKKVESFEAALVFTLPLTISCARTALCE